MLGSVRHRTTPLDFPNSFGRENSAKFVMTEF
jgi:hypothetical protein